MSRTIMVPLDGSRFSESALSPAFELAAQWNATVEVVTVHEPVPTLNHDLWESASREWSERYVEEVVERIERETGTQVEATVLAGAVPDTLQHHVQERDITLVVMSTHGRGALSRIWLGSSTDSFIRHSTVPVLLIRPQEDETSSLSAPVSFKKVLIPVDGSKESEAITEWARAVADPDHAQLTLIRVFPYPEDFASAYLPHTVQVNRNVLDEGRNEAERYLEAEVAKLRAEGWEAEAILMVDSSPARGILHFAAEHDVHLIAMSTHGRGGMSRLLLGSVTDKVVRGAHLPVLVLKP